MRDLFFGAAGASKVESAARTLCRMSLTLWVHATALLFCTFLQQGMAN